MSLLKTKIPVVVVGMLLVFRLPVSGALKHPDPVTPGASPEAKALLRYLQGLSGNYTLTGQHNYPATGDRNTRFAGMFIGKTPIVWSQDFGFSKQGDKDSYTARPAIVQEAMYWHQKGAIITLCWHAVPPTADEPVTFRPQPGSEGSPLASVQGRLTDKQFRDILTPGTALHEQWLKQVDEVAKYLKILRDAGIPVLWRPYHEMNGDWFWWGGRYEGKYTTAALYRQLFERFVNVHKLNNLIWVWSVDRPVGEAHAFDKYYPGNKYLDILSLDVYGSDFDPRYYRELTDLSKGKPVALGEVGKPPSPEVLKKQPNWIYWVVWAGMVRNTTYAEYEKYVEDPRVLFMEDPAYIDAINPYRELCGLPWLLADLKADFTGNWKLNECESDFGPEGMADVPYQLIVNQNDSLIKLQSFKMIEWQGDVVSRRSLPLRGEESRESLGGGRSLLRTASFSESRDTLTVRTEIRDHEGTAETVVRESWVLHRGGRILVISKTTDSPDGKSVARLVYDKI